MIKISFAGPFGHVRRTVALTALVTQQHSFPRQPQSEDMIEQRHEMALLKIEPMHPKSPMMAPLLCSCNLLLMRTLTSVSVRQMSGFPTVGRSKGSMVNSNAWTHRSRRSDE